MYESAGKEVVVPYILAEGNVEDEKSLMILPLFSANDQSDVIGVVKIGNFKAENAFTPGDLRDLKCFGETLSILLHTINIKNKLDTECKLREQEHQMTSHAAELFFWRERVLGAFHQIANYLNKADSNIFGAEILFSSFKEDTKELEEILAKARDSLNLGKQLVQDTQKGGRILTPIMSKCYLIKDVLQPAVEYINQNLDQNRRGWKIDHAFTDTDYGVYLDPVIARESLINILNNAVWAVKSRQITKKKVFVGVRQFDDEERVKIEIQDSGIGISPENFSKLFSPFFTTREDGTGLGLHFARRMMQYFNGDLQIVRSQELKGTTFIIFLPIFSKTKRK